MQQTITLPSGQQRNQLIGASLVLFAACGFSAKAVLIKLAYEYGPQVEAITLMMLRMLMAFPFFLWVAIYHRASRHVYVVKKLDWLYLFTLGFLGYYLASLLDFTGLKYISAGLERLLLFLYPTFVVLFTAILGKRFINRRELLALLLSYGGMLLVYVEQMQSGSKQLMLGSVLVLSSAVVFACFLIGSAVMIKRMGSGRFTAYSMTVACVITILHYALNHGLVWPVLPARVYLLAFLMAIFSTVLPAFLMNAGIHRIGAGKASIISSAGPVGTLVLAYYLLGEAITVEQIGGTLLVLSGVYVVSRQ